MSFIKKVNLTTKLKSVSQSQCQNQKNVIDPENIINSYGADAVRLFILSDSPPERCSMV